MPTFASFIKAWYNPKPVIYNLPFFISLFSTLKSFAKIGENNFVFLGLINVDAESWIEVSNSNSTLLEEDSTT